MKKLFRKLFSPTTFVILVLLLEFLAIIFVLFIADVLLSDEANEIITLVGILLRAILFFIQVYIFFRIINKYENPEFKVTWIAFMSLLPSWPFLSRPS